jgi:hypothetical protein
VVALL